MSSDYTKQRIAVRYWLLGAGYHKAAEAMSFAEGYHQGTRKDGVTPEFAHQTAIVSYLRTLHNHLRHPEETFAVGFLHDVREDYDVAEEELRGRFGPVISDAVDTMTKTFRGVKRDEEVLFQRMAENSVSAIAKLDMQPAHLSGLSV